MLLYFVTPVKISSLFAFIDKLCETHLYVYLLVAHVHLFSHHSKPDSGPHHSAQSTPNSLTPKSNLACSSASLPFL